MSISIHALLAESDKDTTARQQIADISIHALLAESDTTANEALQKVKISIHALLAESDNVRITHNPGPCYFYPRSPCGERLTALCRFDMHTRFLSTLSLRRATIEHLLTINDTSNFYPRSPCGERLPFVTEVKICHNFYPRSPCGERRLDKHILISVCVFLSTLSLRRATIPCKSKSSMASFLSTLSLRRATVHYDNYNLHCVISIHALLAESDCSPVSASINCAAYFYPRSPCGERLHLYTSSGVDFAISIHALLAESDACA